MLFSTTNANPLTPPFVTPYTRAVDETPTPRRSTRQLLGKIPNFPGLYRHSINRTYYAIKKVGGKRKEHSLDTTDRKVAERRFKDWVASLDKIDTEAEKTTLGQLLEKFERTRQGMAAKTKRTERWILRMLRADWPHGLDIQVSRIRPSMIDEWLAKHEPRWKNSSYDRVALFLKQLFDLAVNDRIIAESPFYRVQKGWKRPEKPNRIVPTDEQFHAIVENIRAEKRNPTAEQSANFIEFIGLAGLGQAEVASLKWGDVDWGQGQIAVRRHKTKALFFPPIYPDLRPFLQNLYAKYPSPPNPDIRIFGIQDARKALGNACKRLGYPAFSQRSIRAYRIRRLWQAKVDVKLIAKWQGHNDGGKLILNTYTEVFGGNDAEYISAELAKLAAPSAAQDKNVTLSAKEHERLLAELQALRAKTATSTPTQSTTSEPEN
jgi:integrase